VPQPVFPLGDAVDVTYAERLMVIPARYVLPIIRY
jgi:hypothetical protein